MEGLVDYGSDSGSDDSGDEGLPSGVLVQNPVKGITAPIDSTKPHKSVTSSLDDVGFFGDEADEDGEKGSKLSLPAARTTQRPSEDIEEDEIEDIAKPKEWEKKLADKARRKLEKKALKKTEKEKKREEKRLKKEGKTEQKEELKKKRGPVKIDAFGGLSKTSAEVEEEKSEDKSISASMSSSSSSLKLFSMLPAPKTASRLAPSSKTVSLMIPPSLRTKTVDESTEVVVKQPVKSLVCGVDSSDDEGGDNDFFGLSSTQSNIPTIITHVPGVPLLPSYGLSDEAGPVRPDPIDTSYGYEGVEDEEVDEGPSSSAQMKKISDEAAQNMIFKYDYAPFGHDRRGFNEADIIDVSVDRAIGPNVQENLLKNLNRNNMARASMPSLPTANAPNDKNAKRKHQITYLANIAVAREGELQQKWADGKAAKRMARQKYGF
ncbi:hypothetical protein PRIPAC_76971 [Pristionchus pacificus]|uniref:Uncharacterized protein n=1 Tax=Pristionchus pacificus TaxID=54126 RepID=A0A2A6C3I2_PRIPA|nr:hypothetical protein PRIPAC_76971 [Pristionchus pacificus]|eukprot:PDM72735.1 hypothetical protein PRIPAC_39169 [Pristionchus pacificus]